MIWRTIVSFICIAAWISGGPCNGNSAELNGYTFSDDSTDLWKNPYFSNYVRHVDLGITLYGYGDFANTQYSQSFQQTFNLAGIECVMLYEQGYYPTYSAAGSSFQMDYNTGYVYYAKDTEDNIHVLQIVVFLQNQPEISWSYTDLTEGETTLKYPSNPAPGQQIFRGQVENTGVQVGDIRNCVTLLFDSPPQFPSHSVKEYLKPGTGVMAVSYNWESRINGFSFDAVAPEYAEEKKSTWEEWKDDNCFISTCSPHTAAFGTVSRRVMNWVRSLAETVKMALTSLMNTY